MSLLPYLFDEVHRPMRRFGELHDQHFGLGLLDDDDIFNTARLMPTPLRAGYLRPWRTHKPKESGVSNIKMDKDGLHVKLDVQHFQPEDIKVKVVDNHLLIEGKHEEKLDEHGYISRQFTRRYKIPEEVDCDKIESKLSSDGVLMLHAPPKAKLEAKEREIPITHVKAPAVKGTAQETMEQ